MTQALEQLPHKTCLKFVPLFGTYNFPKHSVEVSKRGHVKAKREEANRVAKRTQQHVAYVWPPGCNMLDDVGSNLKAVKFFVQHFGCCMMLCSFGHVRTTLLDYSMRTKFHEYHYVGELDNPHLQSLRWISSVCIFCFNYRDHMILQGTVSFASAQAKLMHA